MAAGRTSGRNKREYGTTRAASGQMYVYGNAVPKPAYEPERRQEPERKKKASYQVRRNRKNALHMSAGYVVFLAAAAVLALVVCVNYVQLQSRITSRSQNITAMQEELTNLKEANNTKYNAVMDSVNMDGIRARAQELGMVYASADQIVEYENPASDYVKQYEKIPEDGVLAQSDLKSK